VSPLLTSADRQMAQAKVLSHKRFALWSDALIIQATACSAVRGSDALFPNDFGEDLICFKLLWAGKDVHILAG